MPKGDRFSDSQMLDWLERFVNQHGALVLHDGNQDTGKHYGLGLRPGALNRTLREAIAHCMKERAGSKGVGE